MAISETISGNGVSAVTNPTALTTDVTITGGLGNIVVESQSPSGDTWFVIAENRRGAFAIATPDTAINYRFRTTNETKDVDVYFGP